MRGATKKPNARKAVIVVSNYRRKHKRNGPSRVVFGEVLRVCSDVPGANQIQAIKATVFEGDCPVRRSSGA